MTSTQDIIIIPKVFLNEGISVAKVTSGPLIATREKLFILPFTTQELLGNRPKTTQYEDNTTYFNTLTPERIKEISLQDLIQELTEKCGANYIYEPAQLKKFTIKVGWWIFGGMWLQRQDGPTQPVNIQPSSNRAKLREFYSIFFPTS